MMECAICAEPLLFPAIGKCGHRDMCGLCSVRMRIILKDNNCPMCKTECEEMFIVPSSDERSFDESKEKVLFDSFSFCEYNIIL